MFETNLYITYTVKQLVTVSLGSPYLVTLVSTFVFCFVFCLFGGFLGWGVGVGGGGVLNIFNMFEHV